jgi:hypothetical protein
LFKPRWSKISARLRKIKDDRDRLARHYVKKHSAIITSELPATLHASDFDFRQKSKVSADDRRTNSTVLESNSRHFLDLAALQTEMATHIGAISGRDHDRLLKRLRDRLSKSVLPSNFLG